MTKYPKLMNLLFLYSAANCQSSCDKGEWNFLFQTIHSYTLCMLGDFHDLLLSADFFLKNAFMLINVTELKMPAVLKFL